MIRPTMLLVWLERHKRFAWVLAVLPALAWMTYWIHDRAPPFRVLEQPVIQPARAGEELQLQMKVDRDIERRCSATITRYFVDSTGTRRGMTFESLNYEGIKRRDAVSESDLKLALPLPRTMPSGPAELSTEAVYTCETNPLTYLVPIRLSFNWKFDVLPPVTPGAVVVITKPEAVDKALRSLKPDGVP